MPKKNTNGPFPIISKYAGVYLFLSFLLIFLSCLSIYLFGLRLSIEFTGGTIWEFSANPPEKTTITRQKLQEIGVPTDVIVSMQQLDERTLRLRMHPIDTTQKQEIKATLEQAFGTITDQRFETVGPSLGNEHFRKTLLSLGVGAVLITLYLASRFHSIMLAGSALLAAIHDGLILVGVWAVVGHLFSVEVDVLFLTALLTILSFSVHDTIVVYDRIRERQKKNGWSISSQLVDQAVLDTLVRSLRNSIAILIMLLTLFLIAGERIAWFMFALLIGTIAGTYSSTFVALPLVVAWMRIKQKRAKK